MDFHTSKNDYELDEIEKLDEEKEYLDECFQTLFGNIGKFISLSSLEVKNIPFRTAWYYSCINNTNNMYLQLTKC